MGIRATKPKRPEEAKKRMSTGNERANAAALQAEWLAEIGMDAHGISASLRYNRPQSVAEEREVLDVVRRKLEVERTYDEAMRTGT